MRRLGLSMLRQQKEHRSRRQALASGLQLLASTPTVYSNPTGCYLIGNTKVLSSSAFCNSEKWRRHREINPPESDASDGADP